MQVFEHLIYIDNEFIDYFPICILQDYITFCGEILGRLIILRLQAWEQKVRQVLSNFLFDIFCESLMIQFIFYVILDNFGIEKVCETPIYLIEVNKTFRYWGKKEATKFGLTSTFK